MGYCNDEHYDNDAGNWYVNDMECYFYPDRRNNVFVVDVNCLTNVPTEPITLDFTKIVYLNYPF